MFLRRQSCIGLELRWTQNMAVSKLRLVIVLSTITLLSQIVQPKFLHNLVSLQRDSCIALISGSKVEQETLISSQRVWIDLGSLSGISRFRNMLHKEAFCLLSFHLGNMTQSDKLFGMTKPIDKHVTVASSPEKPNQKILRQLNRPLIWFQTFGKSKRQQTTISQLYCPMQGKPKAVDTRLIEACNEQKCVQGNHVDLGNLCPNPFRHQTVRMAADVSPAATLTPGRFNIPELSGYTINLMKLLAKYYEFKPEIYFTKIGHFLPHNNSFTPGRYGDVLSGKADISLAAVIYLFQAHFDLNLPLAFAKSAYITRAPVPVNNFANILRPFESEVWILIGISNMALALVLYQIYTVYHKIPWMKHQNLARQEMSHINFLLYPFAKITEPDPLPWFKKWSTGKIVSFLWSLASAILVMAYMSNLRSHLTIITYEKPPNCLQDIVDSGQRVFMYMHAMQQRKSFLKATGQQDSIKYKIAVIAEETDGLYDPLEHGGLHRDMEKEIIENGAFGLTESLALPYVYKTRPLLKQQNIHIVGEEVSTYYTTNIMRKHSPGIDKVRLITARASEMGLINFWLTENLPSSALAKNNAARVGLQSFDMSHFYASAILYSAGITLAFITFILERACA